MFEKVKSQEEIYKIGSIHRMNGTVILTPSDESSKDTYCVKVDAPVRIVDHVGLEKVIIEDVNGIQCYAQLKDIGEKEITEANALTLRLSQSNTANLAVRYLLFKCRKTTGLPVDIRHKRLIHKKNVPIF